MTFFASLADHLTPLTRDSPSSLVPQEIFVSNEEVFRSLSSLNVAKAVGPDNIPNKLFKDFAHELAPVIRNIYNQSLRERYIPSPFITILKSSIVTPIPKVNPPISLTCKLAKVMEGFTCNKLLLQLHGKSTFDILHVGATRQQMLFYSCYEPFTRQLIMLI